MKRLVLLVMALVVAAGFCLPAMAASQKAMALRQANGLTPIYSARKISRRQFRGR